MTDWRALARARGIPDADIDRLIPPLEALETVFRPLAATLTPAMEPATIYRAEEDPS